MSNSKMKRPRRKRGRGLRDPPLPIPIASLTGEPVGPRSWFYYRGLLQGSSVMVSHSGDISFLYSMGFFGKGSLSRSKPDFSQRFFTARVERPTHKEMITANVISRRTYIRHLKEAQGGHLDLSELCDCSAEEDDPSDEEVENFHPWQPWMSAASATETSQTDPQFLGGSVDGENRHPCDGVDFVLNSAGTSTVDSWTAPKTSWEDADEGDADFWGTKDAKTGDCDDQVDPSTNGDEKQAHRTSCVESRSSSGVAKSGDGRNAGELDSEGGRASRMECLDSSTGEPSKTREGDLKTELDGLPGDEGISGIGESGRDVLAVPACCSHGNHSASLSLPEFPEVANSSREKSTKEHGHPTLPSSSVDLKFQQNHGVCSLLNASDVPDNSTHPTAQDKCGNEETPKESGLVSSEKNLLVAPAEGGAHLNRAPFSSGRDDVDPLCESEDSDGDVLVVADSDDEVHAKKRCLRHPKRWLPVLKKDPLPPAEELHLGLEEAFFLTYGLGCLSVYGDSEKPLGLEDLWKHCCALQENFAARYVVYQHLRSKGWIPKAGLKFSCDFVVYEEGPMNFHSSYCVAAKLVREDRLEEEVDSMADVQCLDAALLSGANRMTETVSKELLICYVVIPSGLEQDLLLSPKCISQLSVLETVVTRWIPSQEREDKTTADC